MNINGHCKTSSYVREQIPTFNTPEITAGKNRTVEL
jgi:hypothetical protein